MTDNDAFPYITAESYIRLLKDAESWLRQSRVIKYAADQVLNGLIDLVGDSDDLSRLTTRDDDWSAGIQSYEVYYYLMGLAIENLLKGTICHAKGDSFIPDEYTQHYLVKLYTECVELQVFDENKGINKILEQLQEYVIWRGKYPSPSTKQLSRSKIHFAWPHLLEASEQLYEQLYIIINRKLE